MKRFTEEVFAFSIDSGDASTTQEFKTDADGSKVVGAVIYHNGLDNNPDVISAEIKVDSKEVSVLQHIENYRSREAGYSDSFKPIIPFNSGKNFRIFIGSDSNFTADFKGVLILIKEVEENYC